MPVAAWQQPQREGGPVAHELLVGSDAFWRRAHGDIADAKTRLLVQAMTFEADDAGLRVSNAIAENRASDRRVLVDSYSRMVINDRFVTSPGYFFDPVFRHEVQATRAMFRGLADQGVGVRRTNPVGLNWVRYGVRNHKKLIVADDIAYIGGINFSDHNFAWNDMMLRIDDAGAASFLAVDFERGWTSTSHLASQTFGTLTLIALDGRDNQRGFAGLFAAIDQAQASIAVISPYPTFPFIGALERAAARGVAVEIFTPLPNNKPIVRDYLLGATAASPVTVRLLPEMSHVKAMLIDGATLVIGSSNFDFASYLVEEEMIATLNDADVIAAFNAQVLDPARASAVDAAAHRPSAWRVAKSHAGLRIAAVAMGLLRNTRRSAIDWN